MLDRGTHLIGAAETGSLPLELCDDRYRAIGWLMMGSRPAPFDRATI
jgi:hypothetical protein